MNVLRGHTTTLCIPSIYSNPFEDDAEEYYYEFYAKFVELYNNKIHFAFENLLNNYFVNSEAIDILKKAIKEEYEQYPEIHEEISERHFNYYYLRIFSMIITFLYGRVFNGLVEWLEYVLIYD